MGDEQLGPDTVNVVHEPDFKGIALGLQPAKSLPSPPSRTTQRAAALTNAEEYGETGVDLIDENDIDDGVESRLEDHGAPVKQHGLPQGI